MQSPCDLAALHDGITAAWRSVDVAAVNGNAVRCRVMEDAAADWHVHADSDELFYVISGTVCLDTEHTTHALGAGQLLVIPARTRHRARVTGRATLLVVDRIA